MSDETCIKEKTYRKKQKETEKDGFVAERTDEWNED
jgi:hypothetical protein